MPAALFGAFSMILCVCALCVPSAGADTVTMNNGTRIDGQVQEKPGGRMVVIVDGRSIELRPEEVAQVEKNEKTGGLDQAALEARRAERDRRHLEETGLTLEQRMEVMELMRNLQSSDSKLKERSREALLAKGKELDLFQFFELYVRGLSPRFIPAVLEVLCTFDAPRAIPLVREHCLHVDANTRITAITLLSKEQDYNSVELIARGLLDHEPDVQIAASNALAALRARETTPILLDNLQSADARVRYVSRHALARIWSEPDAPVDFETHEEWAAFWASEAKAVDNPITTAGLEPLVKPGERFEDE
jgi:hypothetical protein